MDKEHKLSFSIYIGTSTLDKIKISYIYRERENLLQIPLQCIISNLTYNVILRSPFLINKTLDQKKKKKKKLNSVKT